MPADFEPNTVGAMVLAGGRSARMGRDKALLQWGDGTLLQNVVSILRKVTDRIIVVTAVWDPIRPLKGDRRDGAREHALDGVKIVADAYPDCGPIGGILTGLEALGVERCLVTACDMPGILPEVLRAILAEAEPEYDAAVPYLSGRPEPLCAAYRYSAALALRLFLNSGGRAAHAALNEMRTRRIPEDRLRSIDPDLASFVNLNTPEEFRSARTKRTDKPRSI